MALVENYPGGKPIARSAGGNNASSPAHMILENTVDFAEGNVAAGDNVFIGTIPAGTLVSAVLLEVLTEQATVTVAVGDEDGAASFIAAATIAVQGNLRKGNGAYIAAGVTKLYTADKQLWLTPAAAALLTAKLRVIVVGASIT